MDPWRAWAWLTQPAALTFGRAPEEAVTDPEMTDLVLHAAVRLAERDRAVVAVDSRPAPFVDMVTGRHGAAPHTEEPDMTTMTATTAPSTTDTRVSWVRGLVTVAVGAVATTLSPSPCRRPASAWRSTASRSRRSPSPRWSLLGGVIGIVLARHLGRTAFLRTTVALTALSCVPSIALADTVGDKLGLVLTHLVAAAIIVPRLARR